MGFKDSASFWSKINGYDYYEMGYVLEVKKINDHEYHAKVKGSKDNIYDVVLDPYHPKKSSCTCPRAKDKLVVCKHKIAVYYSIFPEEALEIKKEREEREAYQEKLEQEYMERHHKRVLETTKYVDSLTIEEMRNIIINQRVREMEEFEERFYEDPDEYGYY